MLEFLNNDSLHGLFAIYNFWPFFYISSLRLYCYNSTISGNNNDHFFNRVNGAIIQGFEDDVGTKTSFYGFTTNSLKNSLVGYHEDGFDKVPRDSVFDPLFHNLGIIISSQLSFVATCWPADGLQCSLWRYRALDMFLSLLKLETMWCWQLPSRVCLCPRDLIKVNGRFNNNIPTRCYLLHKTGYNQCYYYCNHWIVFSSWIWVKLARSPKKINIDQNGLLLNILS